MKFRLLALALGVTAIAASLAASGSSQSVSDTEAASLIGGACTHKIRLVYCQDLTKTVVTADGDVVEVACPSFPTQFRMHTPADDGDLKPPSSFIATCNGCGKFYKREACNPTIDPVPVGN